MPVSPEEGGAPEKGGGGLFGSTRWPDKAYIESRALGKGHQPPITHAHTGGPDDRGSRQRKG